MIQRWWWREAGAAAFGAGVGALVGYSLSSGDHILTALLAGVGAMLGLDVYRVLNAEDPS